MPPSFTKNHVLSSLHNETQESEALKVGNKNAQCQKGPIFRVKNLAISKSLSKRKPSEVTASIILIVYKASDWNGSMQIVNSIVWGKLHK
jgi:hypothetical protein